MNDARHSPRPRFGFVLGLATRSTRHLAASPISAPAAAYGAPLGGGALGLGHTRHSRGARCGDRVHAESHPGSRRPRAGRRAHADRLGGTAADAGRRRRAGRASFAVGGMTGRGEREPDARRGATIPSRAVGWRTSRLRRARSAAWAMRSSSARRCPRVGALRHGGAARGRRRRGVVVGDDDALQKGRAIGERARAANEAASSPGTARRGRAGALYDRIARSPSGSRPHAGAADARGRSAEAFMRGRAARRRRCRRAGAATMGSGWCATSARIS